MKKLTKTINNEQGFVLIASLMMLMILLIIGIAATNTTTIELQISGNDKVNKMAFYSAESGLSFVYGSPALYGSSNLTAAGLRFPSGAPGDTPEDPSQRQILGTDGAQFFQGTVVYGGSGAMPRNSSAENTFSEGEYNAHFYEIQSTGYGPGSATATVETGVYRVGF